MLKFYQLTKSCLKNNFSYVTHKIATWVRLAEEKSLSATLKKNV